jgi:Lon protease-like protein
MFPLESAALPGDSLPLRIFEPRYTQLVRDCLARPDPVFGTVLITRGREVGGGDIRGDVGVLAHITTTADHGNGLYELRTAVKERIRVIEWLPDDPYPQACIEIWPDQPGQPVSQDRIDEVAGRIRGLYIRVADARGARIRSDALTIDSAVVADPARHLYALAAQLPMGQADRYAILAAPTLAERVDILMDAIETVAAMVEFQLSEE